MRVSPGRRTGSRETQRSEQAVDVVLDAPVGRAEVLDEKPALLAVAGEEIARQVEHVLVAGRSGIWTPIAASLSMSRRIVARRSGITTFPRWVRPTLRSRSIGWFLSEPGAIPGSFALLSLLSRGWQPREMHCIVGHPNRLGKMPLSVLSVR